MDDITTRALDGDQFAVQALVVERDALRAERDRLRDGTEHLAIQARELRVETDRLRAELAALKSQKPIGERPIGEMRKVEISSYIMTAKYAVEPEIYDDYDLPEGVKLYAKPTQPSVPDGWVLVPVEPTPEMGHTYGRVYRETRSHYEAMKAAIQVAPKPGEGE